MRSINIILLLFGAIFFLNACSGKPEVDIPESIAGLENLSVYNVENETDTSIELVEETRYSDTEEIVIGNVVGVVVDTEGRVYIGDYNANKIHVFHSTGSYLTSIGREGDGPEEFRRISQMRIGNGLIHVFDWNQRRIKAFSLETFELVHTTSLDLEDGRNDDLSGWMANSFYLMADENYLVQFYIPAGPDSKEEDKTHRLHKVSVEGRILSDRILELPVGESLVDREIPLIMEAPYSRKSHVTVSGENIYKLWTEDLAIKKFSINGEYKSGFYYPLEKSELVRSHILDQYENQLIRKVIQNAILPASWPAVQDFLIDNDNQFWISRIIDDRNVYEWWVLEPNGELITRFIWPRKSSILQIKKGYLYALETDEETGQQEIVKYLINYSTNKT